MGASLKLLKLLRRVPPILLFVGFVSFAAGLHGGLNLSNRTIMTGVSLIGFGFFAYSLAPALRYNPDYDGKKWHRFKLDVGWKDLLLAAFCAVVAVGSAYTALFGPPLSVNPP